jgi:hypothetical protein
MKTVAKVLVLAVLACLGLVAAKSWMDRQPDGDDILGTDLFGSGSSETQDDEGEDTEQEGSLLSNILPSRDRKTDDAEDLDALRKDTRLAISRKRKAVYKELRAAEQKAFRLKNQSPGLRPVEPTAGSGSDAMNRYRTRLRDYNILKIKIDDDREAADGECKRLTAIYEDVKEDAKLVRTCGAAGLRQLAGTYGTISDQLADER